jgi:hypothetical protein
VTRLLSCDPGGKPGYALLDCTALAPRRLSAGATLQLPLVVGVWGACPSRLDFDIAVTELQWLHGATATAKKRAVLTLAPRAGWQLCMMCRAGATPHAHRPQEWRAALGIQPRVEKAVVAARVEHSLLAAELALVAASRLPPGRLLDVYDAIAIGWADFLRPRSWEIPP